MKKERYCYMCDVGKFYDIYNDIKDLQPEDTLELILSAKDAEEKAFFELVGNFLLQKRQREVIEGNFF